MSGIIAVYALVISVLIQGALEIDNYSLFKGFMHLAAGLSVGLTGAAAGYAIGIVGDMGVRSYMQQSRIFVGMVLILIFGEVLGLYGYVELPLDAARLDSLANPSSGSLWDSSSIHMELDEQVKAYSIHSGA